jgi:hypothetical protein
MTAYELVKKRDLLLLQLDDLSRKTNGSMGRDSGLWDHMGRIQKQIREIDDTLKAIVIR